MTRRHGLGDRVLIFGVLAWISVAAPAWGQTPAVVRCDSQIAAMLDDLQQSHGPLFPTLGDGPLSILRDEDKQAVVPQGTTIILAIKPLRLVESNEKLFRALVSSLTDRRTIGAFAVETYRVGLPTSRDIRGAVTIPWALVHASSSKVLVEDRLVVPIDAKVFGNAPDKAAKQGLLHTGARRGLQLVDLQVQEVLGRKLLTKVNANRGDAKLEVTADFANRLPVRVCGTVRISAGSVSAGARFDLAPDARSTATVGLVPELPPELRSANVLRDVRKALQLQFAELRVEADPSGLQLLRQVIAVPEKRGGTYEDVAVSADGAVIAVTQRNEVRLLERALGTAMQTLKIDIDEGSLRDVSVSPDGTTVAALHSTNRVYLWDVASGRMQTPAHLPQTDVRNACLLDNERILLEARDGGFGNSVWPLREGHGTLRTNVQAVCFQGIDNGLRYVSYDRVEEQIGTARARTLTRLKVPEQPADRHVSGNAGSFSLGGEIVALSFVLRTNEMGKGYTRGGETDLAVWDATTGSMLRRMKLEPRVIVAVAVSPEGSTVAAAVVDPQPGANHATRQTLMFWETKSEAPPRVLVLPDPPSNWDRNMGKDGIERLSFSRDGKLLVAADRTAFRTYVWDIALPSPDSNP